MLPHQLQNLIAQFMRLPGIGPRQAARFVFYLLRNEIEISALENALLQVRKNIKLCENCFLPSLPSSLNCRICANPHRDKSKICVIEKETDALNLEKTGYFQGCYFVLGGFIDPLEKESIAHQRLSILIRQLQSSSSPLEDKSASSADKPVVGAGEAQRSLEVILALTPRREGDFTSLFIEKQLKPAIEQGFPIKITRLGRGLSSGAELEYADEDTLRNALDGRR